MVEAESIGNGGIFIFHRIATPGLPKYGGCGDLEICFEFPQNILQCKEPSYCALFPMFFSAHTELNVLNVF
jgi:hypothetical protein